MNARRISGLLLLTAAVLLLIFVAQRRPAPARLSPAEPVSSIPSRTLPHTEPILGAANSPAPPLAPDLRANLERILLAPGSRPNEAVLTFADAAAYQAFLARAQAGGLDVLGQLDALRTVRVRYRDLAALETEVRRHPGAYSGIAGNHLARAPDPFAPVDRAAGDPAPFRNQTLGFLGADIPDRINWGRGVTIAVLDSGVAPDPTFDGAVRYLNIGLGTLPGSTPGDGHGTSVAALAAGRASDAAGVAPGANILSIRVTDASGTSDVFTVAQGILAAVDAGAPIVNLSLGAYANSPVLSAAIDYATSRGSVIVAAAGNDQAAQLTWPAADPRVISVGAVDARSDQVAFSNSGPQLQVAAPGYGVQTAWLDGQRIHVNGTSASAPLVAGAIAAVMSQNPALTSADAWTVVQSTTSDAGSPGADPDYGHGVLNLEWAMNAKSPTRTDPAVSSHHYDSANQRMEFIVQNRSARPVSGLALEVTAGGVTATERLPTIAAGARHVVTVPVDPAAAGANGGVVFATELVTPLGLADANVANNRRTSRLTLARP